MNHRTTADSCLAIWHRVGGRVFTWHDVKDLLKSPNQFTGMRNRGYVTQVQPADGRGKLYKGAHWQLTDLALALADVREGAYV